MVTDRRDDFEDATCTLRLAVSGFNYILLAVPMCVKNLLER